jgi:hypothetical protein
MPCNKYNCDCDDSSTCKYKKCKPKSKKDKCWNPYINSTPCYPCPTPYNPCPTPYNPCPTPYNPCNPRNSCNPCNPCYQPACAPCNQLKTVNPFLYPNYTIYNNSGSFTIPSAASASYYIYSVTPSTSGVQVTLPLISSLDNCKKRNFIVSNSGSVDLNIYASNTDKLNGQSGSPALLTLSAGETAQFYSDGVNTNWIVINGLTTIMA